MSNLSSSVPADREPTLLPQFKRSGLDKRLEDIAELVFIDAPNAASGPPEPDVEPFFKPPYYEWWNATKVIMWLQLRVGGGSDCTPQCAICTPHRRRCCS